MEDSSSDRRLEWDEIQTLFGGYLNQDFPEDYGDAWNAVRQYCVDSTTANIATAVDELKEILERFHDEQQLEAVAAQLGSEYYPPGAGQTYREWMTELGAFLRAQAEARG
jgi:hypothetical protein